VLWFQAAIRIAVAKYHAKKAISSGSNEVSTGEVKAIEQGVKEEALRTLGDMQESREDTGGAPMTC
jgi:hypothetical protein